MGSQKDNPENARGFFAVWELNMIAMSQAQSEKLFAEALKYIPEAASILLCARFVPVGGTPFFVAKAKGAHIWDVDGK